MKRGWALLWCFGLACAPVQPDGPLVWQSTGASATAYSGASSGEACFAAGAPSPALRAAVDSSAAARGVVLRGDGRLGQLARLLVDAHDPSAPPDPRLLELSARQKGVFDPILEGLVVPVADAPASALAPLMAAKLDEQPFTHYGAALSEQHGRRWLAVVLSSRRLELEPVPRALPTAAPIRLRGRLPGGFSRPRVELLADGAPRAVLSLGAGPEFDVQVPTPRSGLYRVEIVGDAPAGATLLAKLLVYVGTPLPTRLALQSAPRVQDLVPLRAALVANINRTREQAGLPALSADARLDEIAQQHSLDMLEHGFVAHQSPRSGDPKQRVSRAGLSPGLVLETIARAADARTLTESALTPVGEGRNLLARDVTHLGVGIVMLPDAHGATFLATELFAQLVPAIDLATATPRLLSLVNAARVRRGTSTLALDAGLCEVARQAAQRFLAEPDASEQDVVDATDRELGKFSFAYRRVNALLAVTHRLEEAATLEPALDPQAGGLGLGVALGQRGERNGVLAIVMIVGVRR
jgi:uncharacterized protein YkwD